ncbi:uncharacterized protein RCC_00717 [Ramularia collo-cygni]|uniref:Uncharacterized protein n=1 Tax=Ramularia collo-cygni TaxID=112498 RepID=A0A2D3UN94_9PEZI|nr:uncharacterized protein RCC_00717 [Ramularia collo-cygni]CZT14758.1 uncharacterized protein RCC_00717 [Ramularia collo-cygni]
MLYAASLLALSATASAINLFVSDYSGNVTTLSLESSNGNYSLTKTHASDGCFPNPSWLEIDAANGLLYCSNEGLETVNGSLSTFSIARDGSISLIQNTTTISGPVSSTIYGDPSGRKALALAHYTGSAVSTYLLDPFTPGNISLSQEFTYTLDHPPPTERQLTPHPHEIFTDPTGEYLLVPDLGADLVRIFCYDSETLKLTPTAPLKVPAGSGPRHGVFYNPSGFVGGATYFYLVSELTAKVTSYAVTYLPHNKGLEFKEMTSVGTSFLFNIPEQGAPAEIAISPDNRFLVISNRNTTAFTLPLDGGVSDSLSTWALKDDGSFRFHQLWPTGGEWPRHFSMNAVGNFVAVGNQNSQSVVILERDVQSGLVGEPVAKITLGGNVTTVVWDERSALGRLGS